MFSAHCGHGAKSGRMVPTLELEGSACTFQADGGSFPESITQGHLTPGGFLSE